MQKTPEKISKLGRTYVEESKASLVPASLHLLPFLPGLEPTCRHAIEENEAPGIPHEA